MGSYNHFALVYDELTENVEYEKRFEYMLCFFKKYGIQSGSRVLDLACGSGNFTSRFVKSGYIVTGIDSSETMLTAAYTKCGGRAELLKGDMRTFSLPKKYSACVCCLDSLNHLSCIADVKSTFMRVYESLEKCGLFIFDVNTVYKHDMILAGNAFVFDQEAYFLSWDNESIAPGTVGIYLDLFIKKGSVYERHSEYFEEKAYPINELQEALNPFFDLVGIYDDLTFEKPKTVSERLYFVCRSKNE